MAFEPAISSKLDVSMNVNALRLVDPSLNQLQDHATHVVLYSFKPDTNEWEKVNIEGALFIYSRKTEPKYNMTIVNRLNTNNLVEPLNGDMNLQVQEPFLLYRNGDCRIFGIWFYNLKECKQISQTLDRLIKELGNKNVEGMMNMLSVNERRSSSSKIPDGTSKRVLDFFAMAKNTTPCQPPGTNPRPPGVSPLKKEPIVKPQADVKPLLQRLLSNPNQPVKTVDEIEQLHMVTPPKKEVVPTKNTINPRSLMSENGGFVRVQEKKLENGNFKRINDEKRLENAFIRIPEPSPNDSPPDIEPLDRPCSSGYETPNKLPLFTPNMFMTTSNDDHPPLDSSTSCNEIDLEIKPEPLTKAQLLQAVGYLLKNDPDFVNKLHEAYVKSFADRVS